nr:hypothetical protein [Armatimonadota bacterium]
EHVEAASDYYLEHNRLPTDAELAAYLPEYEAKVAASQNVLDVPGMAEEG